MTRVRYIPKETGGSGDIPSSIYLNELHKAEDFLKNDWRLPHSAVHSCASSFITRIIKNSEIKNSERSGDQLCKIHGYMFTHMKWDITFETIIIQY